MIKIGAFAKICNVSTQTLRYYDAEGILKADAIDPSSGYRFYSTEAVEKYKQILLYKELGFSLEEIKKIQESTNEELRGMLLDKKISLNKSVGRIKEQIKTIDDICSVNNGKPSLSEALLIPFDNDPDVVGKWELCGKLLDENKLLFTTVDSNKMPHCELTLLPGGAHFWMFFWTKGILYRLSSKYNFAIPNYYRILNRDEKTYMIVQYMSDECIDNGADIQSYLYRKTSNIAYTEHQARARIDKTDLPFIEDDRVSGVWKAVDYISEISDFDPCVKFTEEKDLYINIINFMPRGICTKNIRTTFGSGNYMLRYTKGFVLDDKEMTAEEYVIKTINGKDFLFVQHKSGDYFYGGRKPYWYVFERNDK